MTEQQKEAIKYIEAQLKYGYIDLGGHEQCELEIIKEAINMWKTIDEWNSIDRALPKVSGVYLSEDEYKELLEYKYMYESLCK